MSETNPRAVTGEDRALSDEEVVARVLGGETALFELIMRRHNQRLYRVARSIVRHDQEAEDVLQQAYVAAYTHLDQFAGDARFSTWLTRITIHQALGRVRQRTRLHEVDLDEGESKMSDLATGATSPEDAVSGRELQQLIEEAVDELPETYRTAFMLREVQQLSVAETAACLDISEENVTIRVHRARAMLRRSMLARVDRAATEAFPFMGARCDGLVARVMAEIATLS